MYRYGSRRFEQQSWRLYAHTTGRVLARIPCRGEVGARPKAPGPYREYEEGKTCCKRKCYTQFDESDRVAVRALVHTWVGGPNEFKARAAEVQATFLVLDDGRRCCTTFLCNVLGCWPNRLYNKSSKEFGGAKSACDISVIAWFEQLKSIMDIIPNPYLNNDQKEQKGDEKEDKRRRPDDTRGDNVQKKKYIEEYQIHCATKKQVWQLYLNDVSTWQGLYVGVSYSYFCTLWRKYFSNVKCRKYLRFSKCKECQRLRELRQKCRSKEAKQRLQRKIEKHYEFVKRERAYSAQKKAEACKKSTIDTPDKRPDILWIAQDATDQLSYGLPHFCMLTSGEKKERLKLHLMIDYVAGIIFSFLSFSFQIYIIGRGDREISCFVLFCFVVRTYVFLFLLCRS